MTTNKYADLSREELITRLQALETVTHPTLGTFGAPPEGKRPFSFASYSRRKIALKFCYSGWEYSGLAIQGEFTPLPTVEAVLFDALVKTRLVDPTGGMEGCEWSRCGRTDRGVSAAGQVVSLYVRSNLNPPNAQPSHDDENPPSSSSSTKQSTSLPDSSKEFSYIHALNRCLPPSIRILAWSPVSPSFDARFSCTYRHYKYLFTAGTGSPINDITAMRDAASRLVGEHDFRNFCKLDPSKQIQNFYRNIVRATIEPFTHFVDQGKEAAVESSDAFSATTPGLYVFDLVGTAFLYHQVRHIMAILLLIGSGLENPSLVNTLLNTGFPNEHRPELTTHVNPDPSLPVVDTKPTYRMAEALPLMLWECGFKEEDLQWQDDNGNSLGPAGVYYTSDSSPSPSFIPGPTPSREMQDLFRTLHTSWTNSLIHTSLASLFLQASRSLPYSSLPIVTSKSSKSEEAATYSLGAGEYRTERKYVPVLKMKRHANIQEANERWKNGVRGTRNLEKMRVKREKIRGTGEVVGHEGESEERDEEVLRDGVAKPNDMGTKEDL